MYLSQLMLNPSCRLVQRDLARPYEMHRTLSHAFPQGEVHVTRDADDAVGLLYRADDQEGVISVLVQSKTAPDWRWLAEQRDGRGYPYLTRPVGFKPVNVALAAGQLLSFRLRANPTKRLSAGKGHNGKRVGIDAEEEQLNWLARKGEQHGFRLLQAQASRDAKIKNEKAIERDDKVHDLELLSVQFDGVLQVTDAALLLRAVEIGIGSGKGFGFGLLSLAPAR
jgi:CRISPR system Cascade subunit CasE